MKPARKWYEEFLTMWKDADPDIPILKQAKAESCESAPVLPEWLHNGRSSKETELSPRRLLVRFGHLRWIPEAHVYATILPSLSPR
jgi:hypothetical protein